MKMVKIVSTLVLSIVSFIFFVLMILPIGFIWRKTMDPMTLNRKPHQDSYKFLSYKD